MGNFHEMNANKKKEENFPDKINKIEQFFYSFFAIHFKHARNIINVK